MNKHYTNTNNPIDFPEETIYTANIWWDKTSPNISKIRLNEDDPDNVRFVFDKNGELISVEIIE